MEVIEFQIECWDDKTPVEPFIAVIRAWEDQWQQWLPGGTYAFDCIHVVKL